MYVCMYVRADQSKRLKKKKKKKKKPSNNIEYFTQEKISHYLQRNRIPLWETEAMIEMEWDDKVYVLELLNLDGKCI